MHARAQDIRIPSAEFLGEEDVGELAVAVPTPSAALFELLLREEGRSGAGEAMGVTGEADDADIGVGKIGRGLEGWEQEFCEEEVAEVVGAELDLESFFCVTDGDGHDACV